MVNICYLTFLLFDVYSIKTYFISFYYILSNLNCKYQNGVYIELTFVSCILKMLQPTSTPTNHLYEIRNVFAKKFAFVFEMHKRVLQKDRNA